MVVSNVENNQFTRNQKWRLLTINFTSEVVVFLCGWAGQVGNYLYGSGVISARIQFDCLWNGYEWARNLNVNGLEILGCACRSLGWTFWKPFRILYTITFSLIGIVRNKVVVWVSFLNVINYCYGYQLWAIKLLHTTPGLAEVFHPLQSNLIWKQGYIKVNIWHLHSLSTDEIRWSKVNWSVRKIYILRPNRDQLRKMQLQGQQILNNKYE